VQRLELAAWQEGSFILLSQKNICPVFQKDATNCISHELGRVLNQQVWPRKWQVSPAAVVVDNM